MYIPPSCPAFHIPLVFCTVAINSIKNMHAVSTNQIADILHFSDKKMKDPKISYIFIKTLGLCIVYSKCVTEYKKKFKEEELI